MQKRGAVYSFMKRGAVYSGSISRAIPRVLHAAVSASFHHACFNLDLGLESSTRIKGTTAVEIASGLHCCSRKSFKSFKAIGLVVNGCDDGDQ
nr:hypothetical protein CFP56_22099 [Quercus suber]